MMKRKTVQSICRSRPQRIAQAALRRLTPALPRPYPGLSPRPLAGPQNSRERRRARTKPRTHTHTPARAKQPTRLLKEEEQKDENEINQDIGQYDPNEIKGLLLALRLQAEENYPFLFLPQEAYQQAEMQPDNPLYL